jgi:mannose-1-phosphate guanylyltransferase
MIQLTRDRTKSLAPAKNLSVVSTQNFSALTKKHLGKINFISEPQAKNTMAAVCLTAWQISQKDKNAIIAILPADAHIADSKEFQRVLEQAFQFAEKNPSIVCVGIQPTFAATIYGYIESGTPLTSNFSKIARFVEKPPKEKAEEFIASKKYLWNAGIFVFKVQTLIEEVRSLAPEYAKAFDFLMKNKSKIKSIYKNLPSESVDTALMEKTSSGALINGNFGWNDIGSWPALAEVMGQNSEAGYIHAPGGSLSIDSHNVVADLSSKKILALVGVQDLIVVETKDAILICSKDKADKIKNIVEQLKKSKKFNKFV